MEWFLFPVVRPLVYEYLYDLASGASQRLFNQFRNNFGGTQWFLNNLWDESKLEFYEVLRQQGKTSSVHKRYAMALNKFAVNDAYFLAGMRMLTS